MGNASRLLVLEYTQAALKLGKTMKITLLWRNGLSEGMFYSYSTLDDVYSTLLHSIQASLTNIFSELLKWK